MPDEDDDLQTLEPDERLFAPEPDPEPEPYRPDREREVFTTPIDPDVQTILSQLQEKSLILNPDFQRLSVWDRPRQSRLIESLLLNIPIPPCFFAEETDGTRIVVDGQQRLRAVDEFYRGVYALTGLEVRADLNGKRWVDLAPGDARKFLRRVLRTIVISHYSDPDIKFEIFRRLNTGGLPLTEQEIRNAIYRGSFNALLERLAHMPAFLSVLRRSAPDKRLRHHELVLRYFALSDNLEDFKPPLKRILNDYMKDKANESEDVLSGMERRFGEALAASTTVFGQEAFRRYHIIPDGGGSYEGVISKAVYDLHMIGLGDLQNEVIVERANEIRAAFEQLSLNNEEFTDLLSRATDHRTRFYRRMKLWAEALEALGLALPFAARLPAPANG